MNKFAGVNLSEIDINNASWDKIQVLQQAFIENFKESGLAPKYFNSPAKIIKHFDQYIRINFTPTLSLDQKMALAIHYLPNYVLDESNPLDNTLAAIRKILAMPLHEELNIKALEAEIKQKRKELELFDTDWALTVQTTVALASKCNIGTALEEFFKIMNIADAMSAKTKRNKKDKDNEKLLWLSLQFIYAASVMEYFSHLLELLPQDELLEYAYLRVRVSLENSFKQMDEILNGKNLLQKYILNSYFMPKFWQVSPEFVQRPKLRRAETY